MEGGKENVRMSSFPSGYGPFGAGKIEKNGECLKAKREHGEGLGLVPYAILF